MQQQLLNGMCAPVRKVPENIYLVWCWHKCARVSWPKTVPSDDNGNNLRFDYVVIDVECATSIPDSISFTPKQHFDCLSTLEDCEQRKGIRIMCMI